MIKPQHIAGQFVAYTAFAVVIAYFASSPPYLHHPENVALIRLSLTHAGQRVDVCQERSADELAKLPPNMRTKQSCGRARNQVTLEMDIDGNTVYARTEKPAGLSGDGRSRFYDSREIPPGRHVIRARMRDGDKLTGFDYDAQVDVELAPRQVFVIDFDEENKTLSFE